MASSPHHERQPPETPFREGVWILPESPLPGALQLSSTGITHRDPAYRIQRPEGAHYYVLECILAGHGHLHAADGHYQPEPGDVYLLPPAIPNEYYTNPDDPWEKIWFNVSGKLMDDLVEIYHLSGVVFVHHAGLEEEFRCGMEAVQKGTAGAEEILTMTLHRILYRVSRLRAAGSEQFPPTARRLKEYLDEHWNEPFSLTDLSRVISRSPAQTMRIFKNAYHTTAKAYHTRRKLLCAIQYLRNTSYTVRMISSYLGFANEFHFSNWFKMQTGESPRSYRNALYRH